jgi:hypothetical protein
MIREFGGGRLLSGQMPVGCSISDAEALLAALFRCSAELFTRSNRNVDVRLALLRRVDCVSTNCC